MGKSQNTILLIDNDAGQRNLLASFLKGQGYIVLEAGGGEAGLEILTRTSVDILISDVRMPGMNGLETLKRARQIKPEIPVMLVTAFADIRDAVKAVKDGAINYLEKPIDFNELLDLLTSLLGDTLDRPQSNLLRCHDIIAESPVLKHILAEIAVVAPTTSRVLITGESGVGKEVFAKLIHENSLCAGNPMITVNCAAMPENLIESELFGHEKGAFTGAGCRRIGRFEEAIGGTLFLDEIGDLPASVQVKLLRVLEEGTFQRLGSNRDIHTDARILAATNSNLETKVKQGAFREDLFYRLNVFELYLPSLRDRPEDVLPLAKFFMRQHGNDSARLSPAVTALLTSWPWPGNARELRNAMERATLLAQGGVIMPEHLPRKMRQTMAADPDKTGEEGQKIGEVERCLILQTLKENDFNRTETAQKLGLSRRALLYKLQKYRNLGYEVDKQG